MSEKTHIFLKSLPYLLGSFLAGFSVMTVEIVSSRIMAPLVGSSIFTWASIIGVTLLGLSVGSWFGGIIADKTKGKVLPHVFLISSIFILFIPFLVRSSGFILDSNISIIWMNLFISLYLFLIPATSLGMIQPMLLKRSDIDHSRIGQIYGFLSAAWSIGSVMGVFLTGFVFISNFGSLTTIKIAGIFVLLVGLFFAFPEFKQSFSEKGPVLQKKELKLLVAAIFLAVILLFLNIFSSSSKKPSNVVLDMETDYFRARVADFFMEGFGNARILALDFDAHSVQGEEAAHNFYPEMYPIFGYLKKNIENILIIGGGAYTMPKYFKNYYPDSSVEVVETDPELEKIAQKYFGLDSSTISTKIGDARSIIPKETKKYDVIYGDAFNSFISVPWFLLTDEWNKIIKKHLKEGGVYAVNVIGAVQGKNAQFTASVWKTFEKTYSNYYVFATGNTLTEVQNVIFVGINGQLPYSEAELRKIIGKGKNSFVSKWLLDSKSIQISDSIILTDEFAPVEKLMDPVVKDYFPKNMNWMKMINLKP